MAYGNLVRNYFVCNAQSALLDPSLVKIELSTKEALAYAALLSYWGCNTITPTWDALLNRSRLGKTALSAALDSLEVKRALERRRFTDRTGRRHVIYFLNVEVLFEQDVIEACGMEDDLYKHSIKEGASDSAVLARVSHLNTMGWKSTRFTTKQVKESLSPEEDRSCDYDEDSLDGFLLSGFPDEMPVEEPREEIYPREGMQPLFGDGADLEGDVQSTPELASDSSDPWPTATTIPGGSEWAPDDAENTSMVFDAPAQRETVQERAERIIRDHPGDDVIDAEIIDVEIVEDETPSDTLIDVPVSQELTIAAPAAPVKAKGNSEGDCEKEFAKFYEIFPRHVGRKCSRREKRLPQNSLRPQEHTPSHALASPSSTLYTPLLGSTRSAGKTNTRKRPLATATTATAAVASLLVPQRTPSTSATSTPPARRCSTVAAGSAAPRSSLSTIGASPHATLVKPKKITPKRQLTVSPSNHLKRAYNVQFLI